MFDFLKKKEKPVHNYLFDENNFNDMIELLLTQSPKIREMVYADRAIYSITYEDVVSYVDRLPPSIHDNRVFSNRVGRIFLAWHLNHMAYQVLALLSRSETLSQDDRHDLANLFQSIEYILDQSSPHVLNNFQLSFFDNIIINSAHSDDHLNILMGLMGPKSLFLTCLNDREQGHNIVGYICKGKGIKVKDKDHVKIKHTYNPSYDFGIIAIEKWMAQYPKTLRDDMEEAQKNLEHLKRAREESIRR